MRGIDVDPLLALGIHPSAENAATRKDERVRAVSVNDGHLQIAIERRGMDELPLHVAIYPLLQTHSGLI
jgi:hypothetical protein